MTALLKSVDGYKDSDTADVYVDKSTKLIRQVKFVDAKDSKNYLAITVPYTGGDDISTVIGLHYKDSTSSSVMTGEVKLAANMKTNVSTMNAHVVLPDSSDSKGETVDATFTLTPTKDQIKIDKPSGAKQLIDVLGPIVPGLAGQLSGQSNILGI
jgi:hypothetical protein